MKIHTNQIFSLHLHGPNLVSKIFPSRILLYFLIVLLTTKQGVPEEVKSITKGSLIDSSGSSNLPKTLNLLSSSSSSNTYQPQHYASFEEIQKLTDKSPFENNTNSNVTVPLGDSAFLHCRVRNLGERSISWYRRRDWHILTSGKVTYTNDERFQVLHLDGSDEWTLLIKFVQKRDNGTYECQVSTGTGIVSYLVHLHVAIPEAFILGNGEHHVEQGSSINLVCIIEKSPKPPEFIFWYHNDRMINYESTRDVKIRNEPGTKTQSTLIINGARMTDSGNYTCKTAHTEPASIFVYITQASGLFSGDKTAAVQRKDGEPPVSSSTGKLLNLFHGMMYVFPFHFHLLPTNPSGFSIIF